MKRKLNLDRMGANFNKDIELPNRNKDMLVTHTPTADLMTHRCLPYDSFCSCFLHLYLMYNAMAATIGPIIYTSLSDISTNYQGVT